MRLSMHSHRVLVVLLLIALIALPLLISACKGPDVDAPDDPTSAADEEARKNAKMNDPDFGGSKKGAETGGNRPPGAPSK